MDTKTRTLHIEFYWIFKRNPLRRVLRIVIILSAVNPDFQFSSFLASWSPGVFWWGGYCKITASPEYTVTFDYHYSPGGLFRVTSPVHSGR